MSRSGAQRFESARDRTPSTGSTEGDGEHDDDDDGVAELLSARGVAKSYWKGRNEVPVLRGWTWTLERGEMLAIMGASGSGKSTLLHILGLLDAPDAGEVRLAGERIDALGRSEADELRNRTFGFIFQFYHLLPELSALENVMVPQWIGQGVWSYWGIGSRLRREAEALLERVGLGHRLTHRPAELSGGEMQRAAIARALAGNPTVLLADEPTGNLDAGSGHGRAGAAPRLEPRARAHYDRGDA